MRLDEHERQKRREWIGIIKAILAAVLVAMLLLLAFVALAAVALERTEEEYSGKPLWVECIEAGLPAGECENG